MKISLLLFITLIAILLVGKNFFYFIKKNLFKNQSAWSGKDIKIKYTNPGEISEKNQKANFLKIIADESKIYLEDDSKEED